MTAIANRSLDGQLPGWTGLVTSKQAITPSDVTVYNPPLRVLYVLGAGDVTLTLYNDDGSTTTMVRTLGAKSELPPYYAIAQVRATGTTATGIEGYT